MLTTRHAAASDKSALVALGLRFLATVDTYKFLTPSREALERAVDLSLDYGVVIVAELETRIVGMIGLLALPHPLTGEGYADEVAWWVDPEHRGALRAGPLLLGLAEEWAQGEGLSMVKMVAPLPSRVGRFLERRGYWPIETAYVKRLEGGGT